MEANNYIKILKDRNKESHIYKRFQHTGLEIAELLNDPKHKALYIKLAKQYDQDTLLGIAKDVSTRKTIENKGGYFMRIIQGLVINKQKPMNKKEINK
ncbi:hypothetical protein COV23_01945 [Candidatus Wolfebacteria bacterium CG10_big_fil_rev_8_21_14_0_10_31_9]|uniref:Uncharacterized protein n=1 Tax=Candidatus Wolfebacteria bacterium CG10_big_fil_rev_8_21_14_0_10_31_9 TaxID=1975070 RepID=A0A2H0RE25_9BACT|nr:MAG: hypothetical protein COV23_01945 [Candidatus Wolfebacteria bacterium CG10_big_fil_rev_8_21_14_0_10_31_9]